MVCVNYQVQEIAAGKLQWNNPAKLKDFSFTAVVVTDKHLYQLEKVDAACRSLGVPLISCSVYGSTGVIFNDFGEAFCVDDVEGETFKEVQWLLTVVYYSIRYDLCICGVCFPSRVIT